MNLSRKLARLETIVSTRPGETVPAFWTPARIEQRTTWLIRFLEWMAEPRAVVVYADLTTLPADQWGPLTRHVNTMATHATMGAWDAYIEQGRPVALPEAVCAILEAHPDAIIRSAYDCEDCGLETPVRSAAEDRRHRDEIRAAGRGYQPSDRAFFTVCPLCGGAVTWQGFNGKRWRAMYLASKAEAAGHQGDGAP